MNITLKYTFIVLAAFILSAGASPAQTIQPDGTLMIGAIRLNPKPPPPSQQRRECADPTKQLLGPLAMSFYGASPWISNNPLMERNCATLLDIFPVSGAPHREEMLRARDSWWSRVVRVRFPSNKYGWTEGLGFAWCSDSSCARNVLLVFTETELIGFCSAHSTGKRGTRLTVAAPAPEDEAWTLETSYISCVSDPRAVTSQIVSTAGAFGARKFVAPKSGDSHYAGSGSSSQSQYDAMIASQANREQAARDAARQAAERAQADAAWRRLQQPNQLGW